MAAFILQHTVFMAHQLQLHELLGQPTAWIVTVILIGQGIVQPMVHVGVHTEGAFPHFLMDICTYKRLLSLGQWERGRRIA